METDGSANRPCVFRPFLWEKKYVGNICFYAATGRKICVKMLLVREYSLREALYYIGELSCS